VTVIEPSALILVFFSCYHHQPLSTLLPYTNALPIFREAPERASTGKLETLPAVSVSYKPAASVVHGRRGIVQTRARCTVAPVPRRAPLWPGPLIQPSFRPMIQIAFNTTSLRRLRSAIHPGGRATSQRPGPAESRRSRMAARTEVGGLRRPVHLSLALGIALALLGAGCTNDEGNGQIARVNVPAF